MTTLGTPRTPTATKLLLLGSGEIGKEIAIEAQRLGVEVIAVDRYANAPAMQVAHKHYVVSMLDGAQLRNIIHSENPDFIVPEIEAIATDMLVELEQEGFHVVPTARATRLTMNREGIRRLAAEELKLNTSPYAFAETEAEYQAAVTHIGIPCVVKPIMSSSGKGQTMIRDANQLSAAWQYAQTGSRGESKKMIVERFIPFDYEVTLLTVRHIGGTLFCAPIGHRQESGDYRESWQPHPMPADVLAKAQTMAKTITDALGGHGVFGVEFFIQGEEVYFSEVSPRPHDTGLVTLVSQDLSEFALHVRAMLNLPIPALREQKAAASRALLAYGHGKQIQYHHLANAMNEADIHLCLFGKPEVQGERRVGVVLSVADDIATARSKVNRAHDLIQVEVN